MEFDWDKFNIDKSHVKHGVATDEAEEVFACANLVTMDDSKHTTQNEIRYIALGTTQKGRYLFIVFTIRGAKYRVISARPMNIKEKEYYYLLIKA